jgi:PAS domain S-box-containing protein
MNIDALFPLVEHFPAGVLVCDVAGRIVFKNPGARRILGHALDEVRSVGDYERFTMVDEAGQRVPVQQLPLARALRGEVVQAVELQYLHPDGSRIWLRTAASPIVEMGQITGAAAFFSSLERENRFERELRRSDERLHLAQAVAGIGHFEWQIDTDTNIWSPELERLYGVEPGTFEGSYSAWRERVHPDDIARSEADLQRALTDGRGEFVSEWRAVWPDGTIRWLLVRAKIFFDADGRPRRMVGINMDVTARKEAEQALREADQRKDRFLVTLSHELRNPLSAMHGALRLLETRRSDPSAVSRATTVLTRQVRQISALIEEMLEISAIAQGKITLEMQPVEVRELLAGAIDGIRPVIEERNQQLALEPLAADTRVLGDPVRLTQVMANLLINAAKYTDEGGRIAVASTIADGHVTIQVRDNGIGIPPDMLTRIFDMFTQVDGHRQRAEGGLGIGLTLVQRLVELHGGSVTAHSDGAGCGSEFTVRLPLLKEFER